MSPAPDPRPRRAPRRSARAAAVALVAACAVLLSGCVSIPSGGPVSEGDPATVTDESGVSYQPDGPQAGDGPDDVIAGFVDAATSSADQYGVARQFLSSDFASRWDPFASVVVWEGQASTSEEVDGTYSYSVTTIATVDGQGHYREVGSDQETRLSFQLVQERGEWRIAKAPDGIALRSTYFREIFSAHALYFFDPTFSFLVPDLRFFVTRASQSVSTRIVKSLLQGPSPWLSQPAVVTAFPEGTQLASSAVTTAGGTPQVDLSTEARAADGVTQQRMKLQLRQSLSNIPSVLDVQMLVDGTPLTVADLGGRGPVKDPQAESRPLVLAQGQFGYLGGGEVAPLGTLGTRVTALAADAATLSADGRQAAVRNASGVWSVGDGDRDAVLLDTRPGLVAPSLDAQGYVWSTPASDPRGLVAWGPDGVGHPVAVSWTATGRVVSLEVARDGARVLVQLETGAGPQLLVASIVRDGGVPISLTTTPLELLASPGTPLDATWVDELDVATLTLAPDGERQVELHQVGGPSKDMGSAADGVSVTGANDESGLRVLTSAGALLTPRGSTWQQTATGVSFVATKR
ncbi:lipoprotein LpqB [Clavibacter michiganensis]|uniref:GerMN domain-containing protein n=2 Tax=Clavibacter michiganensis TaxID=28447 RepID=A5CPU1_CLAM3|nr:lipoprotein LpqB [Clavibacter michiganensis]MDO4018484.1 lipoprotein LpqB [Clavibacter michiganensis]MDO4038189.1 lipoprotein LpqB [Clavibacter michiganensis]MDO4040460.1 lipoprotein LpqB [Clavibacter michiganensis]MDO4049483.1 lipoprotein LpqB [Clavibacter michiganensis]MDO4059044.1 lipoprotein LpqB [Clavibacter michiganensis]